MAVQHYHDIEIAAENVTEYRLLNRGDQIAVEGQIAGIDYYHHGIFLGHDKGVVEFGGGDKRNAKLKTVDILRFTEYGKRRLVRILYPGGMCLPPEIAAENAEKLVANPQRWGAFNVLTNNCEHFAMKCKTGVAISIQVIQKIRYAAIRYAVASSQMSAGSLSGSMS